MDPGRRRTDHRPRLLAGRPELIAIATVRAAFSGYSRHACSELAAAVAYRVLFSLVPFVALLVTALDVVLPESARADLVGWLLGSLPGAALENSVQRELQRSGALLSVAGLVAFGTLLWTASGMTRSVRVAFAVIWEKDVRTAFVRGKLRDLLALGVLAGLVIAAFALSLLSQIVAQAGVDAGKALGLDGDAGIAGTAAELLVTGAATFVALLFVYRRVAPVATPFRRLWPAALLIGVAIDVGVAAYAFYLVQIASFSSVYGPLGAVLAFLALLYLVAVLLLFGAELIVAAQAGTSSDGDDACPPRG